MQSYSDVLDEELKTTTLEKSFVRADKDSEIGIKVTFLVVEEYPFRTIELCYKTLSILPIIKAIVDAKNPYALYLNVL